MFDKKKEPEISPVEDAENLNEELYAALNGIDVSADLIIMCSGTFRLSLKIPMNHWRTFSSGVRETIFFRSGSQTWLISRSFYKYF